MGHPCDPEQLQPQVRPETADKAQMFLNTIQMKMLCCLLNEDLTILWANHCFYACVSGLNWEGQASNRTLCQLYQNMPETFLTIKNGLNSAAQAGRSGAELTVRLPYGDGNSTWVRVSASFAGEKVDGCPMVNLVLTDVDDILMEQEEQALLSEERLEYFKWMMDEHEGNVYISDMDSYELLYLNRIACETLQKTLPEVMGKKCYQVIQGLDAPCPFCTNHLLRMDSFYEWEFDNPVLKRTFMIKDRQINWLGHRARLELSHDMYSTEFKLAKKDREREVLLQSVPGGMVRMDARDMRTILWYGAGFLDLIGYTKKQFEEELHSQCTYVYPDDLDRMYRLIEDVKVTGEKLVTEVKITTHAGDTRMITITLSYVSGEDSWDGIPSVYSMGIDITKDRIEQERQRKALEEAYQTARVANSAKTNFLSSMSHDIRTPMNAIMGMAAIAQVNIHSPEKVHDCLNKINTSSRHLLSLINEVLDMSKIESGKIDLLPENIDLPQLLQNVSDMCRPLIEEKKQEFRISAGRVQHERVVVDGDRLQQVLMNLLSNAIKYTPEGGTISLRINELPSQVANKGMFEFVFTDNGIGMPEDFIPRIFEPFSRAEDSRISKIQGTGLGMAITENIVRMMNGSIEVNSQLGEGSEFVVSIPMELRMEEEECSGELVGHPVLVVDDDQVVCENATALLDELGMRGSWVLSGREAVRCVADAHTDGDDFFAVILDWKMPEMDGLETVKVIRQTLGENVPIIIISAYDYSNIEEEFVKAGADAFITKPLFKSKMLHVLQLFCASERGDQASILVEEQRPTLRGKRVLLAEDNELNREIAIELLEMQGIVVDAVENGQHAVETFQASELGYYAAILMDIQMPVMDGYEATRRIRGLRRVDARTIPILALTANAFTADVGKARGVGMNDHIAKPIDIERLLEALQKWMT